MDLYSLGMAIVGVYIYSTIVGVMTAIFLAITTGDVVNSGKFGLIVAAMGLPAIIAGILVSLLLLVQGMQLLA